ncbi:MAG: 2,3-bisphosphoglycerate-independent phosphoglycerate mutase [Candidatus Omnitrophota bacterium]|jgi:2,3-bisphosphoglycerate-independent phosphoglycerate mutase
MSTSLNKLVNFEGRKGPVLLLILDGVGLGKEDDSNGVYLAKTPCLDKLITSDLYTELKAHGTAVGMPADDDMGNSEVGHNALGAGRIFAQGAKLVQQDIRDGSIFETETWHQLLEQPKAGKTLHLLGLLSDGNVHAHIDHFKALASKAAEENIKTIRFHVLLDGRDVFEQSALEYIKDLEEHCAALKVKHDGDYRIASGGGRMTTTMDRYNADWAMVEKGWHTHVLGEATTFASASEAVQSYYDNNVKDQYLDSFVVADEGKPIGAMQDGDSVVFMNFRGDRAMEMSMAFDFGDEFDKFERKRKPDVFYVGMLQYDADLKIPLKYLVNPPKIDKAIGTYMCDLGLKSFAISETQKYGHVTYFWNGNKSGYLNKDLEKYIEVPSDNIPFDQKPKMKAYEITEKATELLKSGEFQFGRINFPNGDMVGHTGVPEAIIETMEVTDACTAKLIDVVNELGGITVVLADHGNADEMYIIKNGKKQVSTAHSLNPVPCAIVDSTFNGEYKMATLDTPGLANIASTLLNLLGYEKPANYEPSLIEFTK